MSQDTKRQKIVVVGAGPVGALTAIYAAQRGHDVELYELRNDLRDPSTTPLNFTKSINLALSERGINAMRNSGRPELLRKVLSETIPMRGRMVHSQSSSGELTEQSQDYDIHGRTLFAADRGALNKILLDELENLPNVKFFFNHKLTGVDFRKHKAWFEVSTIKSSNPGPQGRNQEVEIDFDLLIGTDGAHSAARYHMMKYVRMDYEQKYIDTLWCEFTIEANNVKSDGDQDWKDTNSGGGLESKNANSPDSKFKISPYHLHIWPGRDRMFIAIPSIDGSFTCTLFLPSAPMLELESSSQPSDAIPTFFNIYFPGVTSLIPPTSLTSSFKNNPHLPLISIKCAPYHFADSALILGDAAHAMVPFYGQGMNAGLEDVNTFFSIWDAQHHPFPSASPSLLPPDQRNTSSIPPISSPQTAAVIRAKALAAYSEYREPDAHAINDLALANYTEMRSSVVSRSYLFRKFLEEKLSVWVPSLGWATKYSRVSFENQRYSEVVAQSERQGKLLVMGIIGVIGSPIVLGLLTGGLGRWRRRGWGRGRVVGIGGREGLIGLLGLLGLLVTNRTWGQR